VSVRAALDFRPPPGGGGRRAVPRVVGAGWPPAAVDATAADRDIEAELLGGHLDVTGAAEVFGVPVLVEPAMNERGLVIDAFGRAGDPARLAALA